MCGIAGVLGDKGPQAQDLVRRMGTALAHRGPDGLRVEADRDGVLAHARLSIIDLAGGWQPLRAAGSTIVGNGEIYNYLELIDAFGLKDQMTTGSDFEPLLHLYALEGEKAFDRLRGMYAFCLAGCDGRTFLVRDPFGIKPLHVAETNGRVLFASEPQAIWTAIGARPGLSAQKRAELVTLNYVVDRTPDDAGVREIGPGEIVEHRAGRLETVRRRPALAPPSRTVRSSQDKTREPEGAGDLVRQLDSVLEASVAVHQRADVPYGLFLSGGLDSSAVAILMARLNTRPVRAYTCGFPGAPVSDERPQAERLARSLNLDWTEVAFSAEDFWRIAPLAAGALDVPTCDYAALPTYRLAEAAKGDLRVVLTGEGGDEIFGGYGRYRRALRPALLGGRASEPQTPSGWRVPAPLDPKAAWRAAAAAGRRGGLSRLSQAQTSDIETWLPNDLLLKLDRCLMAHGLEGRTPFLDPEVAAFGFNLADRFKVRGRYGKWILRRWLEHVNPAADPWARKRGFTVPVDAFIDPLAKALPHRIARSAAFEGWPDGFVAATFTEEAFRDRRWPLVFLALWWAIHVEGATPEAARETYLAP